jgi:hypothetical protein
MKTIFALIGIGFLSMMAYFAYTAPSYDLNAGGRPPNVMRDTHPGVENTAETRAVIAKADQSMKLQTVGYTAMW